MKYTHEIIDNILRIRLSGDLIGEDSGMNLVGIANDSLSQDVKLCIIDISDLRYINSSGIGVLITILTKFRNKGGEVYLLHPSENVQKLLIITKLNAIFQIADNEDEAVQKLKKS
ncbi:MAG TPA: STAS domain-containing protein [Cyclobacteriaceae bacterium]|jgi:anti-sigma B factor antagonist